MTSREHGGPESKPGIDALLTVLGNINWDVSIFEESFARLDQQSVVTKVEEYSGGKGANVAVAAARLLGPRRVAFIGALGSDELATRQVRELKKEGVLTDGIVIIEGSNSGRAYILVNRQGRKSIHSHFGANAMIRPSHLEMAGPSNILSKTSMLVVMDTPTDVAVAATKAMRPGARLIYSPGVRSKEGREVLREILDEAEVLVVDKTELIRLSGMTDAMHASELLQRGRRSMTVVATSGKGGCLVMSDGRATRIPGIDLSLLGMRVVNSTGSGDSFLGVFASCLSWGSDPVEAARWANIAGALKATKYETRGSPTKTELVRVAARLGTVKGTVFSSRPWRA